MAQLSYGTTMAKAFAGMKGDAGQDYVRSYTNSEASAEIPFGVGVIKGAADDRALLPVDATANAKFVGVVLHSHTYSKPEQLGDTGIKIKNMMSVMDSGQVWVTVEEAVAVNDRAFMRHTAGAGGTQKGAWRKSADTATAVELLGCRFLTSTTGAGLALLQVDVNATRAAI